MTSVPSKGLPADKESCMYSSDFALLNSCALQRESKFYNHVILESNHFFAFKNTQNAMNIIILQWHTLARTNECRKMIDMGCY